MNRSTFILLLLVGIALSGSARVVADGSSGPLGEWPDFVPIGYITAPHPDVPSVQSPLYGDWGWIVGEEFLFRQDGMLKLLYHSYHETYMTERVHECEVLPHWALGYDPVTKVKYTPLAQPGGPVPGPAWAHTDTPGYLQHPITGEHLLYNTARPGTKDANPLWEGLPGTESAIQIATSTTPPAIGTPFTQTFTNALEAKLWWEKGWDQNGEIKGGLSEPTPVWVPHLGDNGMVRLFYRGLNGAVGTFWTWRISYADSEDGKTGWVKKGTATFDPSVPGNPAYDIWQQTGFRGAWQAHVTGDPVADGVHMVLTVSNQNYAGEGRISYFWSPDWGDTWFPHPSNPVLVPGTHPDGVPATGFQRTPTLMIDEVYNRYILAYNAGWDADERWRKRTHLAVAPRRSDLDGDGIPNDHDICTDVDDDGFGDPCHPANICELDCAPNDGSTYPGAPEINDGQDNACAGEPGYGLIDELTDSLRFADRVSLSWDAQSGAASYQVARSAVPEFAAGCVTESTDMPFLSVDIDPPGGAVDYYLVRGLLPNEGSWGASSSGSERTACSSR